MFSQLYIVSYTQKHRYSSYSHIRMYDKNIIILKKNFVIIIRCNKDDTKIELFTEIKRK